MQRREKDDSLPGYADYPFQDEDTYQRYNLLLPDRLVQFIQDERLAAEATAKALRDQVAQQARKVEESRVVTPSRSRPYDAEEFDLEAERHALREAAQRRGESDSAIAVYSPLEPLKLIEDQKSRTPDKELHKRQELLYKRLKSLGHVRPIARPRAEQLDFDRLQRSFPHFSEVLELAREQLAFSEISGKPFVIPPMLLGGDPGIGKTRFTQELAAVLGTVMRRLAFDNGQTGNALLGSDKHWANTSYGVVFEMVALGQVANPVILLDEIDKASSRQEGHSLASLHTLLEPVTAGNVRDLSVDLEFNASRVIWIATANDMHKIPGSLRSRFHEFWIEQPTGEQALQMAEVIAQEVHCEMSLPGFEPPAREIARFLAHLSAREQIQALKRAYAAAKTAGRARLELTDLPERVRQEAEEWTEGDGASTGWLH